jgi:hypothetical protein
MTYEEYCAVQKQRKQKQDGQKPITLTIAVDGKVILTISVPPP